FVCLCLPCLAACPSRATRVSRDVPSLLCVSATDSRWMAEVQGLRKRRYGSGPGEPRRLQISEIVRSRRAKERAVSLSLQCEPVRSAQGTGRQRGLQSTRGHCDSCRFGGRVLHRNRPCSSRRADAREPSSRKLLCDPALRSPKERRPVNT